MPVLKSSFGVASFYHHACGRVCVCVNRGTLAKPRGSTFRRYNPIRLPSSALSFRESGGVPTKIGEARGHSRGLSQTTSRWRTTHRFTNSGVCPVLAAPDPSERNPLEAQPTAETSEMRGLGGGERSLGGDATLLRIWIDCSESYFVCSVCSSSTTTRQIYWLVLPRIVGISRPLSMLFACSNTQVPVSIKRSIRAKSEYPAHLSECCPLAYASSTVLCNPSKRKRG